MTGGKKTGKKGFETEEVVRSYFLEAGFFVIRGVKLRHGGDDLTDIDLWLYERSATLGRRRVVIDIKDNDTPKAAERLFFIKGLAETIQVEGTGIATSDARKSLRDLARKYNTLWIDNADLQRLKSNQKLAAASRISDETFNGLISKVDNSHASKIIRDKLQAVKSSVADRFGPSCANNAIESARVFCELAMRVHPNSASAQTLIRVTLLCIAIAAAALDFAFGEIALRPNAEKLASLTLAIRFGEDQKGTEEKLRWTEAAIREFAPNHSGLADQIRDRFQNALLAIPAEGLASIIVKMASSSRLFQSARDLEQAAYSAVLPSFDGLSLDAKTILGAVLDFMSIDRMNFTKIWGYESANAAIGVGHLRSSDDDKLLDPTTTESEQHRRLI